MSYNYKFANLLGTVYRHGNVTFTTDGNTVVCPVGNKLSLYDLKNDRSRTLPVEARYNYQAFAISPKGTKIIAAVEGGELQVIDMRYKHVTYSKKFNKTIKCIKFSPDGKYFAIAKDNCVFIYTTPGGRRMEYNPFIIKKFFKSAHDDVTCIDWLDDSSAIVFGSEDMSVHVCGITKYANLRDVPVAGNTDKIVEVYFLKNSLDILMVTRDGQVNVYECSVDRDGLLLEKDLKKCVEDTRNSLDEEQPEFPKIEDPEEENDGTYQQFVAARKKKTTKQIKREKSRQINYKRIIRFNVKKHLKNKEVSVTATAYFKMDERLAVGLSSGEFLLLDMSDSGELIHLLSIANEGSVSPITSMSFNITGDWLALGISRLGQLVVWEWQSEAIKLKQQGHFNNIKVVAHSPDGCNLATGGDDGKVKLWSMDSSFCYLTRTDHKAAVTGIVFTQSGKAVLSSSLDGTVRAFDLMRQRNFKTLASNKPAQFSCVAVDTSGQLVVAGSKDTNEIFLWSLQTGGLLEVLAGHTGPVVSVKFSPLLGSSLMVSTAWDQSVKVWDGIESTFQKETIQLMADGLCVAMRPDGNQLAVATLDGHITMFDAATCKQMGNIQGRNDLEAGRADADMVTAKTNQKSRAFTTIAYSMDGNCIIAGGQSKIVCIYNVETELLIKRFEITQNRSFDAMDEIIDRKKMAENGMNLDLIEQREDGRTEKIAIPGVRNGDHSARAYRPEVRVHDISFSVNGRSWTACTSEGLLVYSLDDGTWLFDPLDIDLDITPMTVRQTLRKQEFGTAVMMAVRLNIDTIVQEVLENVPADEISVIVGSLVQLYAESLLRVLVKLLEATPHVEFYLIWIEAILNQNWTTLKARSTQLVSTLNDIHKVVAQHAITLGKVSSHSTYTLKYYLKQAQLRTQHTLNQTDKVDEQDVEDEAMDCFD